MILVTGATGFVGRSLMRHLNQHTPRAKAYTGRVNSPLTLREELADVQTIIHLAGAETRGRSSELQHVDVDGTERLLEECLRAEIGHIIMLSRLGADSQSIYPLLRAKGEAEMLLRHSGIPYTIIRSASLFGKEDRFLNTIASLAVWSWPMVWLPGEGQAPFQPLWVEDVARCLVKTLARPSLHNKIVDIAGPERFRYAELVRLVLETAGMRRRPFPLHLRLVRPLAFATLCWWRRPPISRFILDRFSLSDIAPLDSVLYHFGFQPGRVNQHVTYLRRRGLGRGLFR